jgi:hypothetical protein
LPSLSEATLVPAQPIRKANPAPRPIPRPPAASPMSSAAHPAQVGRLVPKPPPNNSTRTFRKPVSPSVRQGAHCNEPATA